MRNEAGEISLPKALALLSNRHLMLQFVKRPWPIHLASLLLVYLAVRVAWNEYHSSAPSVYVIGGYRAVALFAGAALYLFFFPRIGRWILGSLFLLTGLFVALLALGKSDPSRGIAALILLAVGLALFLAKFPVPPPPLPPRTPDSGP